MLCLESPRCGSSGVRGLILTNEMEQSEIHAAVCLTWHLVSSDPRPDSLQVSSPVGSGWCMEGEDLTIAWGEGLPAPQAVMELLSCDCKKECVQDSSTCIQNYLKCTNLCKLTSCANQPSEKTTTIQQISIMTLMTLVMMMMMMMMMMMKMRDDSETEDSY